jgi:hypothetical protein
MSFLTIFTGEGEDMVFTIDGIVGEGGEES